ncbi:substrate-binding domain-containing protein [Planctomycetota bacterium]
MSDKSGAKLHFEVKDRIKELIARSGFRIGDSLPTYKELSKYCRVSLVTVQKAMTLLKEDGIIDGRPGQGTSLTAVPKDVPQAMVNVALVFPTTLHSLFRMEYLHDLFRGLLIEVDQQELECRVFSTKSGPPVSPRSLEVAGVDGAVLVGIVNREYLRLFAESNLPTVVVDHVDEEIPLDYIAVDNRPAVREILEHIHKAGHRHIAYVDGYTKDSVAGPGLNEEDPFVDDSAVIERREEYYTVMADLGLADEAMVLFPPKQEGGFQGERVVGSVKAMSPRPTAILCYDRTIAENLIKALAAESIKCPDDISVAGVMGPAPHDSVPSNITQTFLPFTKMGRAALEHLASIKPLETGRTPETIRIGAAFHPGKTVRKMEE